MPNVELDDDVTGTITDDDVELVEEGSVVLGAGVVVLLDVTAVADDVTDPVDDGVVDDDVTDGVAGLVVDEAGLGNVSAKASCATAEPESVKPISNAPTAVVIRA